MNTVYLKGGLANQMFQYAKARTTAGNKVVTLNISEILYPEKKDTPREFRLDHFMIENIIIDKRRQSGLIKLTKKVQQKLTGKYDFFQDEKFFHTNKTQIKKEFTLKKPFGLDASKIAETINSAPIPISLHIRRGDYVNNVTANIHHGILPLSYYENAIKKVTDIISVRTPHLQPTFFIFTDDPDWAKKNLKLPTETTYVSGQGAPDYEELVLMSICQHHIIANSSFSWWGAWLGEKSGSVIIAPHQWTRKITYPSSPVPERWIRI